MLTELCQELRNWFDSGIGKWKGDIVIENGELSGFSDKLQTEQYYRVMGSVFNDGVHKFGDGDLKDESFNGTIWAMAVPPAVIALANKISEWEQSYGGASGKANSPFVSESFGGYTYTKMTGSADGSITWQNVFRSELNKWRKI